MRNRTYGGVVGAAGGDPAAYPIARAVVVVLPRRGGWSGGISRASATRGVRHRAVPHIEGEPRRLAGVRAHDPAKWPLWPWL